MNILIDTTNLYHNAKRRYDGMVDYDELIEELASLYDIVTLHYYVSRCGRKADAFINYLKHLSPTALMTIKEPYPLRMNGREVLVNNFNVEIAVDALSAVGQCVICSSDYNLLPLLTVLDKPIVRSINIPFVFKSVAECHELTESYIKYEIPRLERTVLETNP